MLELLFHGSHNQRLLANNVLGVALIFESYAPPTRDDLRSRRLSVVSMLLDNGASPNAPAYNSQSPLSLAIRDDDVKLVECLLDHRANPNGDMIPRSHLQWNPILIDAVCSGGLPIVKCLLEHGSHVNVADGNGATSLIYAVKRNDPDCVRLLLRFGADKSLRDSDGRTAADYCSKSAGLSEGRRSILVRSLLAERSYRSH